MDLPADTGAMPTSSPVAQTAAGLLPIGVTVDGVTHREVVLRAATVMDNILATDALIERGDAPDALRLATALMAQQIVRLGTLDPSQITIELLRSMHIADWNALDRLSQELEKKLLGVVPTPDSTGGSTSAPGSSETASRQLT